MANQFHFDKMGVAAGPPILTLPSRENQTQIRVSTKAKLPQLKPIEKYFNIQSFAAVTLAKKPTGSTKLANTPDRRTAIGTKRTVSLI